MEAKISFGKCLLTLEGKVDRLLSVEEFEKVLYEAQADFKEEVIRRMALLKVRDEEIFTQVLKETDVDYDRKVGEVKHQAKHSEKVRGVCEKEEVD